MNEKTGFNFDKYFSLRKYDIFKIIKKYKISEIVEIGSGRTTFLFNAFKNINVISFEQDLHWKNVIEQFFYNNKIKKPIIKHSEVEPFKNGGKMKNLIPSNCDLLYIDGPYCDFRKNFNTFTGKPCFYDIESFIEKGFFPKIIMVDGRTDTVDQIKKLLGSKYRFIPEMIYSLERGSIFSALNFSRHSIFIKKT